MGHVLRRAGPGRRRQQRGGGLRPLPPVRRGRVADEGPRARRLPVLDRLAQDPAGGIRQGQRRGTRLLRPVGRRALAAGIAPMATLSWDLPQALEDDGGWLSKDAGAVRGVPPSSACSSATASPPGSVNEPNVVTMLGYALGVHAPGRKLMFDALPAAHHLLLGHGRAVQALRNVDAASIGTATNYPVWAATDSDEDEAGPWLRHLVEPAVRRPGPAREVPRGDRRRCPAWRRTCARSAARSTSTA